MQKKSKVLFLSTGDCSRSLMAEGLLKAVAEENFQAVSTGIESSAVHPLAVQVMGEAGIDITTQKPKSVTESLKDQFGYVVIVYDSAKEHSPIFPFAPHLLHWSIADPAAVEGSAEEKAEMFRLVRNEIHNKIENFVGEFVRKPAAVPQASALMAA